MYPEVEFAESTLLRKLISSSFTEEELTIFCYDYFRNVHDIFSTGTTRPIKIQLLIEYCQKHGDVENLLNLISRENPFQYKQYLESKKNLDLKSIQKICPPMEETIERKILEIKIKGDFSSLSPDQLSLLVKSFHSMLAATCNASPKDIEIMDVNMGSLLLKISISPKAGEKINRLFQMESNILQHLGIENVTEKEQEKPISGMIDKSIEIDKSEEQKRMIDVLQILLENIEANSEESKRAIPFGTAEIKYLKDLTKITKEYVNAKIDDDNLLGEREISILRNVLKNIRQKREAIHEWPWPLSVSERK